MRLTITLMLTLATLGCASVPKAPPAAASANLASAAGQTIGTIVLVASGTGYRLTGSVSGLPTGIHGFHLHTTGLCEGPAFTSAGGHLNPSAHEHGELNAKGPHLGDLQNIDVPADSNGRIDLALRGSRAELDHDLFDADGTALVIHAAADDYRTNPTGNSGARIACGVLTRN